MTERLDPPKKGKLSDLCKLLRLRHFDSCQNLVKWIIDASMPWRQVFLVTRYFSLSSGFFWSQFRRISRDGDDDGGDDRRQDDHERWRPRRESGARQQCQQSERPRKITILSIISGKLVRIISNHEIKVKWSILPNSSVGTSEEFIDRGWTNHMIFVC